MPNIDSFVSKAEERSTAIKFLNDFGFEHAKPEQVFVVERSCKAYREVAVGRAGKALLYSRSLLDPHSILVVLRALQIPVTHIEVTTND